MADRGRERIGDGSLEDWEALGSGGFGYVYKANHKDWNFEVAIKVLLQDVHGMELEATYMEAAAHQFVPKVYGMYRGIPPDPKLGSFERHGIVMELMEGGSLQSLQQALSGPPPWPLAFRLAHQVALALNFIHNKKPPVVHSDLKPGNVLLDANLNVKIADFGLSMVSTSVLTVTNKSDEGGTLAYTPPEAFEQQDYRLVRSYDVYSYGILLWTILTGKEPYPEGVNRHLLAFRVIQGDRPNLDKIDQSKADGLEKLVDLMKRCWDKDPAERPTFKGCTEVTGCVFSKHKKGINAAVIETLTKLESVNRQECARPPATEDRPPTKVPVPQKDERGPPTDSPAPNFHRLTLDTNTAHRELSLSENNLGEKVTFGEDQNPPDHPDRFDVHPQVLCTEGLTGRCQWVVEWNGGVDIAVAYRGIGRKEGDSDCQLGGSDKSWSLVCDDYRYSVRHNGKQTVLRVRPSRDSKIVRVYLDYPAGTLSFYDVSSDSKPQTHLYTFQNTFTEPLYAGFWVGTPSSSVCLCELSCFHRLKLDTNTAHRELSLSENNLGEKVTWGEDQDPPDHPDRFDVHPQVLCTEGLTGRCHWEVEWNGGVDIAVTYRGICRKEGDSDCQLGGSDKSWSLVCDDNRYSVRHNSKQAVLRVCPSKDTKRVRVYLDYPAGTLSFYDVSSDSESQTHLYTCQNTFTEPLYAGFWVGTPSSSVCLCEQR